MEADKVIRSYFGLRHNLVGVRILRKGDEFSEEYELKVKEINILSPEGQEKAEEYKVKSTPSIFINQTNILGVPTKERLKIAIEKENLVVEESGN